TPDSTTGLGRILSGAGTRGGNKMSWCREPLKQVILLSSRENLMRHLCPENNYDRCNSDSTTEVPTAVDASTASCPL
ncbi:hypothetical protein GBAR_LOCUS23576, partial [Geodia barretti]